MEKNANLSDLTVHWFRDNARALFLFALLISFITLMTASLNMLVIAFETQSECVPHTQNTNDTQTSHRAAKSSC